MTVTFSDKGGMDIVIKWPLDNAFASVAAGGVEIKKRFYTTRELENSFLLLPQTHSFPPCSVPQKALQTASVDSLTH